MDIKLRIFFFGFILCINQAIQAQDISKFSIYETIQFINNKLKSNPPDSSSFYEVDVNYYGQLIIYLYEKPNLKDIKSFARFPMKGVTIDNCKQGINQLGFTSNGETMMMITGIDVTKKYKQAFLRFENKKTNNCESIKSALSHLFQLVLADPIYQEKDISYEPHSPSPASNKGTTSKNTNPTNNNKSSNTGAKKK
jgi:hypothetical protein